MPCYAYLVQYFYRLEVKNKYLRKLTDNQQFVESEAKITTSHFQSNNNFVTVKAFFKTISFILLINLSAGALYGSWMFISDPSGTKIGMSLDYLKNTPFKDYFFPGIVLLFVNGLFPIFVMGAIIRKLIYHNWYMIIQGCLLVGWLTIELIFNKDFFTPVLHYSCYAIGILIIITGTMLLRIKNQ